MPENPWNHDGDDGPKFVGNSSYKVFAEVLMNTVCESLTGSLSVLVVDSQPLLLDRICTLPRRILVTKTVVDISLNMHSLLFA